MSLLSDKQREYLSKLTTDFQSHKEISRLVAIKPTEGFMRELLRLCDNVEVVNKQGKFGQPDFYLRLKPSHSQDKETTITALDLGMIMQERRKALIRAGHIDPVDLPLNLSDSRPKANPTNPEITPKTDNSIWLKIKGHLWGSDIFKNIVASFYWWLIGTFASIIIGSLWWKQILSAITSVWYHISAHSV